MKKAISEAKVQRMRNLVTGKHNAKTGTQIGYKKKEERHVEGDVWEERGKTWTIKNGIKQNFTKLTELRKSIRTPLCCPECGNRMKKRLDKKFYKLRKKCFDCNVADEHKMRLEGTYDQYERKTIGNKLDTMYENVKDVFKEYVESVNKDYITESGHKEEWFGGLTKEQYQQMSDVELEKLKTKIDNYKKGKE
jgi:bacterioferritin-associated ferredoxin